MQIGAVRHSISVAAQFGSLNSKNRATVLPVLDVDLLDLSDQHVEAKSKGPVSSDDLQNAPAAYSKKDWPFSLCLFFITSFST